VVLDELGINVANVVTHVQQVLNRS